MDGKLKLSAMFGALLLGFPLLLLAATQSTAPDNQAGAGANPGQALAETVAKITGVAISPLMGVSAIGAYEYITAPGEERAQLPWYCHPLIFGSGLLLVGACAFKDTFGTVVPPGMKKPFDVLETLENKASGLVATAAFVPITVAGVSEVMNEKLGGMLGAGTDLPHAWLPLAAIDLAPLLTILLIPLGMVMFALVWMVSHAINVLILLSPFPAVDTALKAIRISVLGALTGISYLHPWLGAMLSLAIVVIAYFLAGWAFRLTIFGTVFVWDYLSFASTRCRPGEPLRTVFAARRIGQAPIRSLGRLEKQADGGFLFSYRPWLVWPVQEEKLPAGKYAVGRGFLHPVLIEDDPATKEEDFRNLFTLPPRYCRHEEEISRLWNLPVEDVGLRKGFNSIVRALRSLFGWSPRPA